jgi:hypothetical protein
VKASSNQASPRFDKACRLAEVFGEKFKTLENHAPAAVV